MQVKTKLNITHYTLSWRIGARAREQSILGGLYMYSQLHYGVRVY